MENQNDVTQENFRRSCVEYQKIGYSPSPERGWIGFAKTWRYRDDNTQLCVIRNKKKKIIHNCQILACPKILVEYSMKKVCLNSVHEILGYKKIMFVLKYENNFYNEKKNMKS